jgi:hypothetical protein
MSYKRPMIRIHTVLSKMLNLATLRAKPHPRTKPQEDASNPAATLSSLPQRMDSSFGLPGGMSISQHAVCFQHGAWWGSVNGRSWRSLSVQITWPPAYYFNLACATSFFLILHSLHHSTTDHVGVKGQHLSGLGGPRLVLDRLSRGHCP